MSIDEPNPADHASATNPHATTRALELCDSLGFALAGITLPEPSPTADALHDWLNTGQHGEMAYLENNNDIRADPRHLLPGARAVICVADRYHTGARDRQQPGTGRVARYARGDDYHRVMKRRLHDLCDQLAAQFPDHAFRACVDTAPILEREIAAAAGMGVVGKHTLLIEPGIGSWLLLGEVFTTLPLVPHDAAPRRDVCGSCTRCIDACPTDAITPYKVDASRCISYLTIEHRRVIAPEFHEPMGDWLFGCDICQEVCPHCQPTRRAGRATTHEAYEPRHDRFDLLDVLGWSEQDRRDAFVRSAMKRAKLAMIKRNALIAAGNWLMQQDDAELRAAITALADDAEEPEIVRNTARQTLHRIGRR